MKNKKSLIIVIIIIIGCLFLGLGSYLYLKDDNKLTSNEKKWINDELNTVHNINVINNVNIFGSTGVGVYYDFLTDFELEYKLQINPVTFSYGESVSGVTLGAKKTIDNNDTVFYTDHYVLVGKKDEIIANYNNFANKKIGILSDDLSYITSYLNKDGITFTTYQSRDTLLQYFKEPDVENDIDYMIVPLTMYLDEILTNDYYIIYHLSDAKFYYTISTDGTELSSILKKYYLTWSQNYLDEYYKKEEFKLFTKSLEISETEVDAMQSITYQYGFVNNSPYEVIMSGNYGGIIAMYLHDFSKFSNVEFNYVKYRNLNNFKKAIDNGSVDLYFNYYNLKDEFNKTDSKILAEYSIIANEKNDIVIESLNSLNGYTVYVQQSSVLSSYLKQYNDINIKTYDNETDLKKLNKKDAIIVIDANIYELYSSSNLSNYTKRYQGTINSTYQFKVKNNNAFYKLFNKYVMTQDSKELIYQGMYNHNLTVKSGSLLGTIAKYILIILALGFVLFIIFYRKSKKIKVAKKIKKENKMKFIDQLTSLKNRNYLNEYINNWNNNTIYPQTMIIIDLNNIQFINDTLGYEEGDKQIKAAANILIKNQLDNSDIMRTDGNEFLIYLVGYTQKQVINYIHKLNKEFKKLPYEYGAEFGYSMINDSIKTIEDAILEATEEMKKQKKKEIES